MNLLGFLECMSLLYSLILFFYENTILFYSSRILNANLFQFWGLTSIFYFFFAIRIYVSLFFTEETFLHTVFLANLYFILFIWHTSVH